MLYYVSTQPDEIANILVGLLLLTRKFKRDKWWLVNRLSRSATARKNITCVTFSYKKFYECFAFFLVAYMSAKLFERLFKAFPFKR